MRRPSLRCFFLFLTFLSLLRLRVAAGEDTTVPGAPLGWVSFADSTHELFSRPGRHKVKGVKLTQGTLGPVFRTTVKDGVEWAEVRLLDLATASLVAGWVEAGPAEILPAEAYPNDSALLAQIGAPFVDDFAAKHTRIARFLLPQGAGSPLLLCYIYSTPLPLAKLVAFTRGEKRFLPGTSLDFPLSELHAGPVFLEVRDLIGDGNDCFITHEPFSEGPETRGKNLVIRRVEGTVFRTLWQAPLELRNLSEFRSKIQILEPPENNLAAPGTVATGAVTFRSEGRVQEPVWKGKIEFFLFGREEAADAVTLEKACPWNGREFAPLH